VGNGGAGAGEARGTQEGGAGQQVRGTWPAKAAGFTGASRTVEGELEVEDRGYVAEPPELFRLKCAIDCRTIAISLTHFKRNNPLVYRVSARYNHGSTGPKQVYLARRRVHITE
jgi:hypothetical protein